jgi:hypothetical protein
MVPNETFVAEMRLLGYGRGRSSAVFLWVTPDGQRFQMFMTDMVETIRLFGIEPASKPAEMVPALWKAKVELEEVVGYSTGLWRVIRRGENYGLQPVDEEDEHDPS